MVLQGIDQLDVADGAGQLAHITGYALIALAAYTGRPIDRGALAGSIGPLRADLAQEVGPDEGGAASIGAMDDDDLLVGQMNARIVLGDARIVPAA